MEFRVYIGLMLYLLVADTAPVFLLAAFMEVSRTGQM